MEASLIDGAKQSGTKRGKKYRSRAARAAARILYARVRERGRGDALAWWRSYILRKLKGE